MEDWIIDNFEMISEALKEAEIGDNQHFASLYREKITKYGLKGAEMLLFICPSIDDIKSYG